MLKAFLDARHSEDAAFWEGYFSPQSLAYLIRLFPTDPLRPLFERYCTPGARVLEGGCGLGNYVTCLERLGCRPVGLDFAMSMLLQFRRVAPGSRLTAGDVCALPFRDRAFDVYYSGGVMEHFETGPGAGLAEACRVLRPGGVFLCSVPYENPIRRVLGRRRPVWNGMVLRAVEREAAEPAPDACSFFQYFYRSHEFRAALERHGFDVVAEQPYSLWRGLTDVPPFRWLDSLYARRAGQNGAPAAGEGEDVGRRGRWRARAKEKVKFMIFAEDRKVPLFGTILGALCELAANMRMYVCRKRP